MNRRVFIGCFGASLLAPSICPAEKKAPVEAERKNEFGSFDAAMESFMAENQIPGGSLAVVKDQRLVYARGYGWADKDKKLPVKPESLFRIASISKPFTAVAILKLVEQGKLKLDQRVLDFIRLPPILDPGAQPDPRWQQITIRHLLQHTGGWDRDKSFDPMFRPGTIARAAGVKAPADSRSIIRYMLGKPLDFDPGEKYAYSNFGYCLLGRIIEAVTRKTYESFVKESVLSPIGIRQMRLGRTMQAFPLEVRYYAKDAPGNTVFPDIKVKHPAPYGSFYLEAMDAHGGWIASAVDLMRFAAALHDPRACPILQSETCDEMRAPPAPPVSRKSDGTLNSAYYGCGWNVRPVGKEGKANYWHGGRLQGTSTLLVRRWDGLSWAALFNLRLEDRSDIDAGLHRAADAVKSWPSQENLFSQFGDPKILGTQ